MVPQDPVGGGEEVKMAPQQPENQTMNENVLAGCEFPTPQAAAQDAS